MTMLGRDALMMELDAMQGVRAMGKPHDEVVIGLGRDDERVRQACALDHQRMVAGRLEWPIDAAKNTLALVLDLGQLAVHLHRGAHHLAAERLSNGLVTEADSEQGNGRRRLGYERQANAR